MSKYLISSGIFSEVELLVREARECLYIINPTEDLLQQLKESLVETEKYNVQVSVVFGKPELANAELGYLENLHNARVFATRQLTDKCFISEKKMIISAGHEKGDFDRPQIEMGILFDRSNREDNQAFEETVKGIELILWNAQKPLPQSFCLSRNSIN